MYENSTLTNQQRESLQAMMWALVEWWAWRLKKKQITLAEYRERMNMLPTELNA